MKRRKTANCLALIRYGIILSMILGTLFCVLKPDIFFLIQLSGYAVHFMFFLLFSGLVFLTLNTNRMLVTAFVCAGIIAWDLNENAGPVLVEHEPDKAYNLRISLANLTEIEEDINCYLNSLIHEQSDLVVFQEVTPEWLDVVEEIFHNEYPYKTELIRLDPYGQLVYSKYPIIKTDTFFSDEIPILKGTLELSHDYHTNFYSLHFPPAFDLTTYQNIRSSLIEVSKMIESESLPVVCLGDLQSVPWSQEIKEFKFVSRLTDSRRSISPAAFIRQLRPVKMPFEHIFFSNEFQCSNFRELMGCNANRIGFSGDYRILNGGYKIGSVLSSSSPIE